MLQAPCHSLFLRVAQRRKGKQKQTTNVLIRSNNNRAKTYKVHRKNQKKKEKKRPKKERRNQRIFVDPSSAPPSLLSLSLQLSFPSLPSRPAGPPLTSFP
jgi:hypothetical protein